MTSTALKLAFVWTALAIQLVSSQSRHNQYASILQDTRNEPTPDGYFGYLYKTEDGIVSSARGDPSGVIHGTFSYTDPTGLKVNYNYNAGSRHTPGLGFHKGRDTAAAPAPAPSPAAKYYNSPAPNASRRREPEPDYGDNSQYYSEVQDDYVEPAPRYRPRRPISRDAADVYQERRNRQSPRGNTLYDDGVYRG